MISAKGHSMLRVAAFFVCCAGPLLTLAGCAPSFSDAALYGFAAQPPDASPDYTYVPIIDPNRPCCVQRWVLAPRACLAPDSTEPPLFGPHLPPACANNYNLMRMAARKRDLREGRRLGAAPAAPSARAAQQYIYGGTGPLGGGLAGPSPAVASDETDRERSVSSESLQPNATARPNTNAPEKPQQ
jgi:hypothetical protein